MSLWLAILLLTALPAQAGRDGADLSTQFSSSCRSQGKTGSCHAFASVALLEAAIKRRRGAAIELSDADLFVRSGLTSRHGVFGLPGQDFKVYLAQAGDPYDDLAVALSSGVAYRRTAPWENFQSALEKYDKERERACRIINGSNPDERCRFEDVKSYAKLLNRDKDGRERLLLGDPEPLEKDRAEVRAILGGLTVDRRDRSLGDFDASDAADVLDKSVCREKGRKQTETLLGQLNSERPAIICFALKNLPDWKDDADSPGNERHCAVVYAYETAGKGVAARRVFKVRNSWGTRFSLLSLHAAPNTHDIDEDHACAIFSVVWLTP